MTHILILADDLFGALEEQQSCRACVGGLGIHVEDREWAVVQLHREGCTLGSRPALRLVGPGHPTPAGGAA